ncbi:lytic transglycosylase domain-containing protein [Salmonella enterica]|nr:lytic transglycosylase domain-containing protein [Salmonella enterica]
MAIKIPVSAQFDAADLKQQIQMVNDQIRILSTQVGMANNKKYEPINVKSKEDLEAFVKQMQKLLKIQTELGQVMQKSGQGSKNPLMADWSKMYGDKATRMQKMQNMLQFLGVEFDDHPAPKPKPPAPVPPGPRPPVPAGGAGWQNGWGRQGLNVLNSGLHAAGPVGGVFSGALNSGLSGGAGAGLMGLVGGLAALGVGKIIGAIADKVGQAQDNAIGLDKLYRQVGGVATYAAWKSAIGGSGGLADTLGMKTQDAIGMASAYSRANLRPGENPMTGLLVSGGLARTLGLDPTQTAGIMGGMRGANIGRSDQETRRIGGLIGEAIGRSGAFGQANEALGAITNYATSQARQSLTGPNIAGYGGALAGLMNTGLPGMDVQGAAGLLGRVNASLSRGGNMGDASQAFTARVGMGAGMNPFQLKAFQEGGMFATRSSMFGENSPYGRAFGAGKGGDTTYFDMVKRQMGRQYGEGSEQYYLGLANHLGVGVNEAMTIANADTRALTGGADRAKRLGYNIKNSQMGQMGVIEGGGAGLGNMARSYLGRKDLSGEEKDRLMAAYKGNDSEKLKDVMTEMLSKHGGTKTEGSQIRDNVAKLDNTFTRYADRALPSLDMIRMAVVKMAGGGEDSLRQDYEKSMRGDVQKQAQRKFGWKIDAYTREMKDLEYKGIGAFTKGPQGDRYRALKVQRQKTQQQLEGFVEQGNTSAHNAAYGAPQEGAEAAVNVGDIGESPAAMTDSAYGKLPGKVDPDMLKRMKGMEKDINDAAREYGIRPGLLRALIAQESRFKNGAKSGKGAVGATQLVPKWNKAHMKKYNIYEQRGNIFAGAAHLREDLDAAHGDENEALGRYNGGTGPGRRSKENREYAPGVRAWEKKLNEIDPQTMPNANGTVNVKADPLVVEHRDASGQTLKTEQVPLATNFQQARGWGAM